MKQQKNIYVIQFNWSARLYFKIKTEHKILSYQAKCKYGREACLWEPLYLLESYTQTSTQVKQGWARWLNIFCNFTARLCNWKVGQSNLTAAAVAFRVFIFPCSVPFPE